MIDQLKEARKPYAPSRRPAFSPITLSTSGETAPNLHAAIPSTASALARKACVVAFRSGEAVIRHPDLKGYLEDGWAIESAVPQLTDAECVELLVVLSRCSKQELVPVDEDDR